MSSSDVVPVLQKAIRVLEEIARSPALVSAQQIATAAGVASTSCFRILNTLEGARWIARPVHGHGGAVAGYRLSYGLLPLLESVRGYAELFEVAREEMDALATRTQMSVKLSVREGDEAVTVVRSDPPSGLSVTSPIGSRHALAFGATGAALLASSRPTDREAAVRAAPEDAWQRQSRDGFLGRCEACQRDGSVVDRGSYREHIGGVAAPLAVDGVHAAVTVTGLVDDLDEFGADALAEALREATSRINARLDRVSPVAVV